MKKGISLALFGIIAMAVFSLGFISCEQPTDQTMKSISRTEGQTLPPPANVRAEAYLESGVIRLTWDAVANAAAYDVYRRGGSANVTLVSQVDPAAGGIGTELVYDDIIDFNNELRAGESYTYKVVAKSDWSSNPANAGANPWTGGSVTDPYMAIVQNSSADSNSVAFSSLLPANSKLPSPANLNVVSLVAPDAYGTGEKTEIIRASWNKAPGLSYQVRYSLGNEDVVDANSGFLSTSITSGTGRLSVTAVVDLPIIRGGKINVEVIAYRATSGVTLQTAYYLPSDPASKSIDNLPALLTKPVSFSAAANTYGDVELTWTNPDTADDYEIYRLITDSNSTAYTNTGIIYTDWVNITAEVKKTVRETSVNTLTGAKSYAGVDSPGETLPGQALYYAIVAKKGSTKSEAAISSQVTTRFTAAAPVLSWNFSDGTRTGWWDSINKKPAKIVLSWTNNSTDFYTYQVYRAAAVSNSATILGPKEKTEWKWEAVGAELKSDAGMSTFTIVDDPPVRNAYRYKLVTTIAADAVTPYTKVKTLESYTELTVYPYQTNRVNIALQVRTPVLPTATPQPSTRESAYRLQYKIDETDESIYQLKNYILQDGERIKITRSLGTVMGGDEYAVFGFAKHIDKNALDNLYFLAETVGGGYIHYRIEAVDADGKAMLNTNRDNSDNQPLPGSLTLAPFTGGIIPAGEVRLQIQGYSPTRDGYKSTKVVVKYAFSTVNATDAQTLFDNPATVIIREYTLAQDSTDPDLYYIPVNFPRSTANQWVYGAVYYQGGTDVDGTLSTAYRAQLW